MMGRANYEIELPQKNLVPYFLVDCKRDLQFRPKSLIKSTLTRPPIK